jgi:hypothetical protein
MCRPCSSLWGASGEYVPMAGGWDRLLVLSAEAAECVSLHTGWKMYDLDIRKHWGCVGNVQMNSLVNLLVNWWAECATKTEGLAVRDLHTVRMAQGWPLCGLGIAWLGRQGRPDVERMAFCHEGKWKVV